MRNVAPRSATSSFATRLPLAIRVAIAVLDRLIHGRYSRGDPSPRGRAVDLTFRRRSIDTPPVVTLRVGADRVTFDGVRWSGDDLRLVEALEVLTPRKEQSPSIPRWDVHVAESVLRNLEDAAIVDVSPPGPNSDAGVVY